MVSVCLPSDALLQHLPSYLGFSYLGHGLSLHALQQSAATAPDLGHGVAPLGCSCATQLLLLTSPLLENDALETSEHSVFSPDVWRTKYSLSIISKTS